MDFSKGNVAKAFGRNQNVGEQWPTMRYFNKATGYGGQPYKQKDKNQDIATELGAVEAMREWIMDEAGTSQCDVVFGDKCSEKELKFIQKWWANKEKSVDTVKAELSKAEQDLSSNTGKFDQNKKKIKLLGQIISKKDLQ